MNKEKKKKKLRKLSERIFAIGLTVICEIAFLLWLLQPCSDATASRFWKRDVSLLVTRLV